MQVSRSKKHELIETGVSLLHQREKERRWDGIRRGMAEKGYALLIVFSNAMRKGHVRYLSNYSVIFSHVGVLFPLKGEPQLLAFSPIQEEWSRKSWICNAQHCSNFAKEIVRTVKEKSLVKQKIGFVGVENIPPNIYQEIVACLPSTQFADASDILVELRKVKSGVEISLANEAANLADEACKKTRSILKKGINENQIFAEIDYFFKLNGVEESFNLIASGKASYLPYLPTGKELNVGDNLLVELTPQKSGYYAQLTFNITLGRKSKQLNRLIGIWKEAYSEGLKILKPGQHASKIAKAMKKIIEDEGCKMPLGGGHGLGLDVVESPILTVSDQTEILPGMILVLHPSVFMSGFGGVFMGSTYLITLEGPKPLNGVRLDEVVRL